jgi:hypothetical protein
MALGSTVSPPLLYKSPKAGRRGSLTRTTVISGPFKNLFSAAIQAWRKPSEKQSNPDAVAHGTLLR